MGKSLHFTVVVLACLAIACIALCACSSESDTAQQESLDVSAPESDDVASDSAGDGTESALEPEDDGASEERRAEIDAMGEEYFATLEEKDQWADNIIVASLNDLVERGVIAPLPDDFEVFSNVFQFKPTDDGYTIDFLDEAAADELIGDFSLDLSDGAKVAICDSSMKMRDPDTGERLWDVFVFYHGKDNVYSMNDPADELLNIPTLHPGGHHEAEYSSVPQDVFANDLDECDYLIAYGGCEANVVEDYYSIGVGVEGSIDRTDVTTVVMVMDARECKVLHIQIIGTDVPGGSGDLAKGDNYGDWLNEEATDYIVSLLTAQ